ncbi:hypothetical protein Pelo_12119 [Pelomyxa schiedti]|nr:hypothetical protein Pelo_12119 [Pelomyxa schiedti]
MCSAEELTSEVWEIILKILSPVDCCRMSMVSTFLHRVVWRNEKIWRHHSKHWFAASYHEAKRQASAISWSLFFPSMWRNEVSLSAWNGVYDELWADVHFLSSIFVKEDPVTQTLSTRHVMSHLGQEWTVSGFNLLDEKMAFSTQGGHSNWTFQYLASKSAIAGVLNLHVYRITPDNQHFTGYLIKKSLHTTEPPFTFSNKVLP